MLLINLVDEIKKEIINKNMTYGDVSFIGFSDGSVGTKSFYDFARECSDLVYELHTGFDEIRPELVVVFNKTANEEQAWLERVPNKNSLNQWQLKTGQNVPVLQNNFKELKSFDVMNLQEW